MRPAVVLFLTCTGATLGASACTRVGVRPPEPAEPAGPVGAPTQTEAGPRSAKMVFAGTVTFGNQRLPVVLELRRGGPEEGRATLRIPAVSMEAIGAGSWSDDHIRLELTYGEGCPGTVAVNARVTAGGARGTLEASDCTGSDSGALVLARRATTEASP